MGIKEALEGKKEWRALCKNGQISCRMIIESSIKKSKVLYEKLIQ